MSANTRADVRLTFDFPSTLLRRIVSSPPAPIHTPLVAILLDYKLPSLTISAAQVIEITRFRRTHNPKVVGSNPTPATKFLTDIRALSKERPFRFTKNFHKHNRGAGLRLAFFGGRGIPCTKELAFYAPFEGGELLAAQRTECRRQKRAAPRGGRRLTLFRLGCPMR